MYGDLPPAPIAEIRAVSSANLSARWRQRFSGEVCRMLEAAQRLKMPIEQYLKLFFAWRSGKPVNAIHFDKLVKKKAKR